MFVLSKIQGATSLLNIENPATESNPIAAAAATTDSLKSFLAKFNLKIFVYDYDRGFLSDDLIGYADVELDSLRENVYVIFGLFSASKSDFSIHFMQEE